MTRLLRPCPLYPSMRCPGGCNYIRGRCAHALRIADPDNPDADFDAEPPMTSVAAPPSLWSRLRRFWRRKERDMDAGDDPPFWADNFDMDFAKLFPQARAMLGAHATVELVTTGGVSGGRLNHPSVWNGDHTMLAFFGRRSPGRPAQYWTSDSIIRCTVWEAVRDAWPHHYLFQIDGRPVWDTFQLQRPFEILLSATRGWGLYEGRAPVARQIVLRSYERAVRRLKEILPLETA